MTSPRGVTAGGQTRGQRSAAKRRRRPGAMRRPRRAASSRIVPLWAVKWWSKIGQKVSKSGRKAVKERPGAMRRPRRAAPSRVVPLWAVKQRSNRGQTVVKQWSNGGPKEEANRAQIFPPRSNSVKSWSKGKEGRSLRPAAVRHGRRLTNRPNIGRMLVKYWSHRGQIATIFDHRGSTTRPELADYWTAL